MILSLSTIIMFGGCEEYVESKYAKVQLTEGLPKTRQKIGGFKEPVHVEIKSNNLLHKLYFVKDLSSEKAKYSLFVQYDSLSLMNQSKRFSTIKNYFHDSLTIKLNDEDEHLIGLELIYDESNNNLKYHWMNSTEKDDQNLGGYPILIEPKISIGSVPPNIEVIVQSGREFNLSVEKSIYIFLDFWGTWCGGCIMEMPNIEKLRSHFSQNEMYIIGLAAFDTQEKIDKFLAEHPLNYEVALIDEAIVENYGVESFPSSFLIDPMGKVIGKNLRGEDLIEQVKAKIEKYK